MISNNLIATRESLVAEIEHRVEDKILERTNADLLIKLIRNADSLTEAISIAQLGTTYKRTGLHYDKRIEKFGNSIKYFKKNEELSFSDGKGGIHHKLIIGDNFDALGNLLIQYRGKIDVIYIDPPYGKDSMGEFAQTNYNNALTRDNLLSMLHPRLELAKQLLKHSGVIFCSVDDKNQAYIKCLFDEVFAESNFIAALPTIMNLKGNQDEFGFAGTHEYTLVYAINKSLLVLNEFAIDEDDLSSWSEDEIGYFKQGATLKRTGVDGPRERRPYCYYPIIVNKSTLAISSIEESEYSSIYSKEDGFNDDYVELLRTKYTSDGYAFILPEVKGSKASWRWGYKTVKDKSGEIIVVNDKDDFSLYKKQRPELGELPSKKPKTLFYKPEYSSGNGANQLRAIGLDGLFNNPKPVHLLYDFLLLSSQKDSLVLDFFAGTGTTLHAVAELNRKDSGSRVCILCTSNEKTDTTPNGIAYDVTAKRLKRIMTGECYDGTKDFAWAKDHEPYGGSLDVYEIESVSNSEHICGKTPFDVIDEALYGKEKFAELKDKIQWVCENFEATQRKIESDSDWKKRQEE